MSKFAGNAIKPPIHAPDTVHLMIDVQLGCVAGLSQAGAQRYLDHMGGMIEDFRANNIPTLWVAVDDKNLLLPGKSDAAGNARRHMQDLVQTGFFTVAPLATESMAARNAAAFSNFLEKHGPRGNEDIFSKRFLDAFIDERALHEKPALLDHLLGHRRDETRAEITAALGGVSLAERLRALGVKNVLISGMEASVCPIETALGAARNDFNATLLTNGLASYRDADFKKTPAEFTQQTRDLLKQMTTADSSLRDDPTKAAYAQAGFLSAKEIADIGRNIALDTHTGALDKLKAPSTSTAPAPRTQTVQGRKP